jgi:hypothetical protein
MTQRMVCAFALAALLAATTLGQPLPADAKVTFPDQDDLNEFTGGAVGCDLPPQLLAPVEQFFARAFPKQYIRYDTAALNRRGVMGLYYVYSGRACRRLQKYFPATIFVMARVHLRKCDFLPDGTTQSWYDVEAKVYLAATRKEEVIFKQSNVARSEVATLLVGRERELVERIAHLSSTFGVVR